MIERALKAGYEPLSFLVEHKDLDGEAGDILARYPEIPVYTAEYETLVKMTGYALARGMLCAMKRRTLPSVEEICKNSRRVAILENIVNPTNIGAIFRLSLIHIYAEKSNLSGCGRNRDVEKTSQSS